MVDLNSGLPSGVFAIVYSLPFKSQKNPALAGLTFFKIFLGSKKASPDMLQLGAPEGGRLNFPLSVNQ